MKTPELTVCLDDLRLDVKRAMHVARDMGFRGIDVGATSGPISPRELSLTGRRHLIKHLSDLGLRLGSLRGPVGDGGYADAATSDRRLATMREVIGLASTLRVPVVSTTIGRLTGEADTAEAESRRIREAMKTLANEAERQGVIVAIESAGIGSKAMQAILADIGCPRLAACCDTGAMLMQGEDPHRVSETLPGRIQLVRARDAIAGSSEASGYETAFGEGHLDPARLLASLVETGFDGDIVISRRGGENPAGDIQLGLATMGKYTL